jgi:hypothetical protein
LFVARVAHLRRPEHDRGQLAESLLLFFDQQLRIAHYVDEDMPDLEAKLWSDSGMGFYT